MIDKKAKRLEAYEGRWETAMGAWFPGERVVFRGQDLHADLGDASWLDVYLYGITGRRFKENELKLINAMWVMTSFPDPRLWNNRVAALAGTARSTGSLGVAAAIAVSEARVYGRGPDIRAIDFLQRTLRAVSEGRELTDIVIPELKQYRSIGGFGRPIVREDERINHLRQVADSLGLGSGPHTSLAFEVESFLETKRYRMNLNFGGLTAALCADMQFDARQFCLGATLCFVAGMFPSYIDTMSKAASTFYPCRCDNISYEGPVPRSWTKKNL